MISSVVESVVVVSILIVSVDSVDVVLESSLPSVNQSTIFVESNSIVEEPSSKFNVLAGTIVASGIIKIKIIIRDII
jgi:hypothetical protein